MPRLRTPEGHLLPLPPHRVSLGESPGCDVAIAPGHGVAGVHLHLQPWESGYFLEDAASGLGTLVNGSPVTWAPLQHGDIITAGGLRLLYEDENSPPLTDFPDHRAATAASAEPEAEAEAQPPSWLPAEALLPPLSPVAQAALKIPHTGKSKRRGWWVAVCLGGVAAAGAAMWWFWLRHR